MKQLLFIIYFLRTSLLNFFNKKIGKEKTFYYLKDNFQIITLFFLIILFIFYYTLASFLRYDNFYTGRYDLGNMTQTVWNTAHGRVFTLTNPDGINTVSRLAFHADFILVLFAPLYWLWESPKVLLIIQTVSVGLGGIFVYLLANRIVNSKNIALTFSLMYLLNPALSWSVLFDFHPVVLATPLLIGAIYFLLKRKYLWFIVFALLAALTKEHVWLSFAFFGPILFFIHKKRMFGFIITTVSLGLFYFLIWHAIPQAASSQAHFALSYFEESGKSPSELIKQSIFSPVQTLTILIQPDSVGYLLSLFLPLGFLSLISPFWLIFAGGDFALNLLSDKQELHQIYFHYTAIITPFLFVSAIYGIATIKKIYLQKNTFEAFERGIVIYLLLCSVLSVYLYGPLPGTRRPNDEMFVNQVPHRDAIEERLSEIPIEKSVAASNELGAQLSHRQNIYTLGIDVTKADYVAFFTHNPDPSEQIDNNLLIDQLTHDSKFKLWYRKYGLTIFEKRVRMN